MQFVLTVLALVGSPAPPAAAAAPPTTTDIPFRTDATTRIDPLFGDTTTLRAALDRFLALQGEMDGVHDEFSTAVHETLAALQPLAAGAGGDGSSARAAADRGAGKRCPTGIAAPYARALATGERYLALGHQLQGRYREIRRGDDGGDSIGLTPDYRWKVRRAREQYTHLLGDYREMRVAFYDQLGAELRQAGCKPGAARPGLGPAPSLVSATTEAASNPLELSAWALDPTDDTDGAVSRPALPRSSVDIHAAAAEAQVERGGPATAIWIEIDNALCDQPTRVVIDGQLMGELPRRNKTSVRTRAGPHELCVLPLSDTRTCGQPGTLRKAYLHEGWSLTVHCAGH
jgi:hypothetical protein